MFDNLHQALRVLYLEMMPLCSNMTGIAKGIAGLGALFYVAHRVWQSLARAEQIDVYPLLRPFAIGLCIMFFPTIILGTMNAVLSPIVRGTNGILEAQVLDMEQLKSISNVFMSCFLHFLPTRTRLNTISTVPFALPIKVLLQLIKTWLKMVTTTVLFRVM